MQRLQFLLLALVKSQAAAKPKKGGRDRTAEGTAGELKAVYAGSLKLTAVENPPQGILDLMQRLPAAMSLVR